MPDLRHEVQEVFVDGEVEMAPVVVTGTLKRSLGGVNSRRRSADVHELAGGVELGALGPIISATTSFVRATTSPMALVLRKQTPDRLGRRAEAERSDRGNAQDRIAGAGGQVGLIDDTQRMRVSDGEWVVGAQEDRAPGRELA